MTTFESYLEHKLRDPRFRREYERQRTQTQKPAQIQAEAARYRRALPILEELRRCRKWIGDAKFAELRKRAISGDVDGATRALGKLMNSRYAEV